MIADVALEECMKAIHKCTDTYHVVLIPHLCSPLWLRMLYKLSDVVLKFPTGSRHWPSDMHEPLFIGISLPLLTRSPWTLRRMPLLVGLERELQQVLREESFAQTFANPKAIDLRVRTRGTQVATLAWDRESSR
jgi:hypothetical protein